ncbi:MAG: hybrid sensor histidine kinase/response regulator [Pirellula sp.]|nr:hybrid sensor histidine kinase/response regulator [Pirellula sp.]
MSKHLYIGVAVVSDFQILLLEDSRNDAELVRERLRDSGLSFQLEIAVSRREFENAVSAKKYDLILADHTLPDYDGRAALRLVRSLDLDTPFIFVSGTLGEELAVDMLKLGANDYVLKQRLDRLLPAVRDAVKLVEERRDKRRIESELKIVEQRYRQLVEDAPDGIFIADSEGKLVDVNRSGCEMLGRSREQLLGRPAVDLLQQSELPRFEQLRTAFGDSGSMHSGEWELRHADGSFLPVEVRARSMPDGRTQAFVRDIRERKQAENALREADQRKDEFLAMLAHELRNPLAPIRNALHVLKMDGSLDVPLQRAAEVMTRQVDHMVRLVDDLLDVSRITRGKIVLRREPTSLNDVIARAVEAAKPLMDAREHCLRTSTPNADIYVFGDGNRLAQVVINLLVNAAKFTPNRGTIDIMLEAREGQALIKVRDDGIGIAPDALTSIFELFTQADRTLDRAQGGLGIGLTLVRRIVEMHDGVVEAQSSGLNQGSEFTLRIPIAAEQAAANPRPGERPMEPPTKFDKRLRVLIVDDNHDSAATLAMLVRLWGCDVATAYNGHEALQLAVDRPPQLMLLDLGLPGMDGFEVIRQVHELEPLRKVRVVALTGYGGEEDRRRTAQAGFHHHFVKPTDPQELRTLLTDVMRNITLTDGVAKSSN